jgi:hypothetical protein
MLFHLSIYHQVPVSLQFCICLLFSSIVGCECCAIGKFPDRNDLFTILFLAHLQLNYTIRPIRHKVLRLSI